MKVIGINGCCGGVGKAWIVSEHKERLWLSAFSLQNEKLVVSQFRRSTPEKYNTESGRVFTMHQNINIHKYTHFHTLHTFMLLVLLSNNKKTLLIPIQIMYKYVQPWYKLCYRNSPSSYNYNYYSVRTT